MTTIFSRMLDRGPRVRPPTMRVEHTPVDTTGDEPGYAAPDLEGAQLTPQRLVWNANGQPSTLSLRYRLSSRAAVTRTRPEEAHRRVGIGSRIVLRQEQAGDHPGEVAGAEWFRGHVAQERPLIQAHPDVEGYEVVAFGPEILLAGKPVAGQWHKTVAADDLHIAGTLAEGDAGDVMPTYLPAVFNPQGQPNAANVGFDLTSADLTGIVPTEHQHACRVFDAPGRKAVYDGQSEARVVAEHWTAYTAVRSLIEGIDAWEVISPFTAWGLLSDMLSDQVIGSVNVQGMNLLQALKAVLMPIGFGFCIEPWADPADLKKTGRARHRLILYSLYCPANVKTPRLADISGDTIDISSEAGQRVEVQRLDFLRDASHVRNHVLVVGDVRRRTVCLYFGCYSQDSDLLPFWDTVTHGLSTWGGGSPYIVDPSRLPATEATRQQFFDRYHADGKDHAAYKHVFRSFVWNEDGALADVVGADKVPDLSDLGVGDGTNFVRRPRPLGPTFIFDEATAKARFYPVQVELGIVILATPAYDANSWIAIPAAVFADRAGFSIAHKHLAGDDEGSWHPYQKHEALKGTYGDLNYLTLLYNSLDSDPSGDYGLALRITSSVETDEAVTGSATRVLGTVWPYNSRRVVYAPNRFKRRDLLSSDESYGAPSGDPWSAGTARHDTRDDRADAAVYAQLVRNAGQNALGHGSITIRFLTRAYRIGDGIPHTAGREVQFYADSGSGEAPRHPIIASVTWELTEGVNKTELALDSSARQLAR